jgi:hypothetical protein
MPLRSEHRKICWIEKIIAAISILNFYKINHVTRFYTVKNYCSTIFLITWYNHVNYIKKTLSGLWEINIIKMRSNNIFCLFLIIAGKADSLQLGIVLVRYSSISTRKNFGELKIVSMIWSIFSSAKNCSQKTGLTLRVYFLNCFTSSKHS